MNAAAASTPPVPEKRKRKRRRRRKMPRSGRHIPAEITEKILLNLPVKSLIRFSSVSKSWNSMIFEPGFIRKHKDRSALLRRHRIIISAHNYYYYNNISCFFALSSISSDLPIGAVLKLRSAGDSFVPENPTLTAADPVGIFHRETRLRAVCEELWCVEVEKSLYLWNPAMRNYRKIPNPVSPSREITWMGDFIYGLGYDSVSDDCKILKIPHERDRSGDAEMYSLKNNRWRMIESPPSIAIWLQERCELLHGNFHYISYPTQDSAVSIVSVNLSSEKYGTIELPEESNFYEEDDLQVVVVSGMLCACLNSRVETKFCIWVMKEYGVEGSWTLKFDIQYGADLAYLKEATEEFPPRLRPLHIYDNDDILITAFDIDYGVFEMVLYKGAEATRIASCVPYTPMCSFEAFLHVESLISVGHNE